MPHRPSSARVLSSNLESSTPSSNDTLYKSCLQALPLSARTSRLSSVASAHQQRPGKECDANAEGGGRTAVVESQERDGGTRAASSRASLPDSAVAKRRWQRARGIARTGRWYERRTSVAAGRASARIVRVTPWTATGDGPGGRSRGADSGGRGWPRERVGAHASWSRDGPAQWNHPRQARGVL